VTAAKINRLLLAALSAVAVVAALGLSACSHSQSTSGSSAAPSTTSALPSAAAAPQTPPAPAPEALTDVLYRLADPSVPGTNKLNLVEGATPDDANALDQFASALHDGGYAPMTVNASDIAWSNRNPAAVMATINVTTPNPGVGKFSFPMEFKPYQGGWQLSQQTAAMLLAFGNSHRTTSPTPTP
jgi:hypothetical protein